MDYRELEKICASKDICIWGYGRIGKSYAYLTLKCAGAHISCFCDNKFTENESYEGIPLIKKDDLYRRSLDICVFIAIKDIKAQEQILIELESFGVKAYVFNSKVLTEICNSLEMEKDKSVLLRYSSLMNDEKYLCFLFKQRLGYELCLRTPKSFNEKLQWLKIHDRNPLYNKLADKAEVKKIIEEVIGDEYIIPTLGVWDSFDDVDFESLPNEFVLKCTHDSGSVIICTNKRELDMQYVGAKIRNALCTSSYWIGREWPYKDLSHRIIAEEYIGEDLTDYKFMCFYGEPIYIFTCTERYSGSGLKVTWFDQKWDRLDFERHYPSSTKKIAMPAKLEKMLDISRALSKDIPFVRVDLYEKDDQIFSVN